MYTVPSASSCSPTHGGESACGLSHSPSRPRTDAKDLEQVVELAVDVAADGDGGADGLDVGLCETRGISDCMLFMLFMLVQASIPSIKISLTFSHSSFMALSGR